MNSRSARSPDPVEMKPEEERIRAASAEDKKLLADAVLSLRTGGGRKFPIPDLLFREPAGEPVFLKQGEPVEVKLDGWRKPFYGVSGTLTLEMKDPDAWNRIHQKLTAAAEEEIQRRIQVNVEESFFFDR